MLVAAAESIELSGIVSSLFCGITMNHYTLRSMSPAGKQLSASVCKSFTIIAETTVFVLVCVASCAAAAAAIAGETRAQ